MVKILGQPRRIKVEVRRINSTVLIQILVTSVRPATVVSIIATVATIQMLQVLII